MHILQAVIMGIVQGLSEFLPISSSAHLVITSNLYKVFVDSSMTEQSMQEVFLDIMLHLGTLIAVLIYFRKDIKEIITDLLTGIKTKNFSSENAKLGLYIILGTIVTVLIAFPLKEVAEKLVFNPIIVGFLLIITGFILFYSEHYSKKLAQKSEEIDLKTSIIIAAAQGLAALPGFSRSGLTIAAGLFNKKSRITAARYSFLLSIPIILGASLVYPIIKIDFSDLINYNWVAIILGTIVSGISGYICIKYFLKFVGKYSLAFFGYYCIIAGILTSSFFCLVSMGL
ncbi:MAG: undecaprenyl-diphosphate phosphatase [Candidatus Gastranaerophilales bacterium]|nr:undecaprenyl-diphosphate phosphatase [Candidatus Gastranaerophilales bacterium]